MVLLNIVSLPKHIDELRMSEFFNYFDLFALNETGLDSTNSDGLVKISGFNIVRNDRSRKGGGVCIYLHDYINHKMRKDLIPDGLETVCLEICKTNSRSFIVISVYRPPNSSSEFFFAFENLIKSVDDENKEFHILGDLDWDMLKDDSDPPTIILKGILESYKLFQLINEAARITYRSRTLIDHYITSTPKIPFQESYVQALVIIV